MHKMIVQMGYSAKLRGIYDARRNNITQPQSSGNSVPASNQSPLFTHPSKYQSRLSSTHLGFTIHISTTSRPQ